MSILSTQKDQGPVQVLVCPVQEGFVKCENCNTIVKRLLCFTQHAATHLRWMAVLAIAVPHRGTLKQCLLLVTLQLPYCILQAAIALLQHLCNITVIFLL